MIKKYLLLVLGLSMPLTSLFAQERIQLSLSEAYTLLEKRYPLLENGQVLDQIYQKELTKIDLAKRPSLYWKTDGRLQSESVSLDTEGGMLPFEIDQPIISVKTFVEANYTIIDGGINEAQQKIKTAQLAVDQQHLEVERFALRERINQLFVRINMLRAQTKLLDISLEDLSTRKLSIAAGVESGVLLESELIKIEVKILTLKAQQDKLRFGIEGLINSLSQLIGEPISNEVNLSFPNLEIPESIPAINRPEYKLFEVQRDAILAQSDMIEAQRRPKLNAFAQAGVGYPNPLNILDSNVAPFGIIGAQFQWQLTDWKKSKLERELLSLQSQRLMNAEASLDFNLKSKEAAYLSTVRRLKNQIENDEQIALLQADILQQLAAQLDEGVITSSEYLTQLNAELSARQNLSIHQTELLQAQIAFLNERGSLLP